MKGRFITFEGAEGVGKTTNIKLFAEILREKAIPFYLTREPGGTKVAEKLRNIALTEEAEAIDSISELLIMFAARRQHIVEVIKPKLEAGEWVLCDRFTDSTYAYQTGGRELDANLIHQLKAMVHPDLMPYKTFLFHCSLEVSRERVNKRGNLDRFEKENTVFFENVRRYFFLLADNEPERFEKISTDDTLENIANQLRIHIDQILAVS